MSKGSGDKGVFNSMYSKLRGIQNRVDMSADARAYREQEAIAATQKVGRKKSDRVALISLRTTAEVRNLFAALAAEQDVTLIELFEEMVRSQQKRQRRRKKTK
jgi:hypothetical protein